MCTNITLKSADNKFFNGTYNGFFIRTITRDGSVWRDVSFKCDVEDIMHTHYAFMGLAKDVGSYYVADGVNEFG